MFTQIRQLNDNTFELGTWITTDAGEAQFFSITNADNLKEAIRLANELDDGSFKQSKWELDLIGGLSGARDLLELLEKNSAYAIEFKHDEFNIDNLTYLSEQEFFDKIDTDTTHDSSIYTFTKFEIEMLMHDLRFLELE